MKKVFLSAAVVLCGVFGANAQLSVLNNGRVQIGEEMTTGNPGGVPLNSTGIVIPDLTVKTDTLASLTLLGPGKNWGKAYMTFGDRTYVAVGEYNNTAATTNGNTNTLWLNGNSGIICTQGSRTVFSCGPITSRDTTSFVFTTPLKARQFVTTSDARLKKDVRELEGSASLLSRLTPVSYELIPGEAPEHDGEVSATAAKASAATALPRHYGFLAQEVKEIFPELVVEDGEGMLGIDYNGFIPLLLDAVKGMQSRIEELEERLEAAGDAPQKIRQAEAGELSVDGPVLSQNRPNPFSASTVIECNVEEGISEAMICVYDLQGKQLLHLDIPERGRTSVTIEASTLPAGMYIYSLIADGRELGTKRMIVTD